MADWMPSLAGRRGPKYLALAAALAEDIASGRLAPGAPLPPQRELAARLGIDLTTVTRALNEVRRDGLIEAAGRRGSFVRDTKTRSPAPAIGAAVDLSMNLTPHPASLHLCERLRDGYRTVLEAPDAAARLHYQEPGGALTDRSAAAEWLRPRLGAIEEDRVMVAGGAQAALSAICHQILAPNSTVIVGRATFPGMKALIEARGYRAVACEADGTGLDPDHLEQLCRTERPAALYCVPTLDNPTTATLPVERRQAIAKIARAHDLTIIEDDAYGALVPDPLAAIATLAPERTWHIASLAKCATPALRIAYVVAPTAGSALRLSSEIHASSIMAPPLNAALATLWLKTGTLAEITQAILRETAARHAILVEVLGGHDLRADPHCPHAWLSLPQSWTPMALAAAIGTGGLSVVPAEAFAATPDAPRAARLSLGAFDDLGSLRRSARRIDALLAGPPGPAALI
ncbi:aminotransferase-like domain-containing protein [Phreatobacter aquaticus]|nr:PLP-dependent aminotransferase family protein [Phreatobacter aquaticus]